MSKIKEILATLRQKSKLDYKYFHVFNNHKLTLDFELLYEKTNHIVVLIRSSFSYFIDYFQSHKNEDITDVFLEDISFTDREWNEFISMKIKGLFWLRLNNIEIKSESQLVNFLGKNSMDLNRIYLENLTLGTEFYEELQNKNNFGRLTFLNLDSTNITDEKFDILLKFLKKNSIKLEYLSLINNNLTEKSLDIICSDSIFSSLRILDLSGFKYKISAENLNKLFDNLNLKELYFRGCLIDNLSLEMPLNSSLHTLGIGGKKDINLINHFKKLSKHLYFSQQNEKTGTLYIKKDNDFSKYSGLEKSNLSLTDDKTLLKNSYNLPEGVNLFLFDLKNYSLIDALITQNNFNYIYLENYTASLNDLKIFFAILAKNSHKTYKINLISILLNDEKIDYISSNLPKNIEFIEVNLAKVKAKEKYIMKMCQNSAFIFENEELYRKIFSKYGQN